VTVTGDITRRENKNYLLLLISSLSLRYIFRFSIFPQTHIKIQTSFKNLSTLFNSNTKEWYISNCLTCIRCLKCTKVEHFEQHNVYNLITESDRVKHGRVFYMSATHRWYTMEMYPWKCGTRNLQHALHRLTAPVQSGGLSSTTVLANNKINKFNNTDYIIICYIK
jgi:hypothetical protein